MNLTIVSDLTPGQTLGDSKAQEESDAEESKEPKPVSDRLSIPFQEGLKIISKGGKIQNENGLIYTLMFKSDLEIQLVSVGYEYVNSAPTVNFFNFDLHKIKNEDTGELMDQRPKVQSPIPQQFVIEYPLIAYKSFMSDNSEVVVTNLALKTNQQFVYRMRTW